MGDHMVGENPGRNGFCSNILVNRFSGIQAMAGNWNDFDVLMRLVRSGGFSRCADGFLGIVTGGYREIDKGRLERSSRKLKAVVSKYATYTEDEYRTSTLS